MPSRVSEASMAGQDVLAGQPAAVLARRHGMNTLVAMTTSSRLRIFGTSRPVATSLAPFE